MFNPDMSCSHNPIVRYIVDLGQEDGNYIIIPTGQSSHYLSPFYDNVMGKYYNGEYIDFSISDRHIPGKSLWLKAKSE